MQYESPKLVLASSSVRRRQLLNQLGIRPEIFHPDIDEHLISGESALEAVNRLAYAKATYVGRKFESSVPVLAGDTLVSVDTGILGKPQTKNDYCEMMHSLSGRCHEVMSGVVLRYDGSSQYRVSVSQVRFKSLSEDEIKAYWDSTEPLGKSGGYAIQGRAGAFVEHLRGSYTGVMGLPLYEVSEMLKAVGLFDQLSIRSKNDMGCEIK